MKNGHLAAEKSVENGEEGAKERERKGLTQVEIIIKKVGAYKSVCYLCLLAFTLLHFLPSS